MGEELGEWPVRLKNDVNEPALLPKKPVLRQISIIYHGRTNVFSDHFSIPSCRYLN